MKIGITRIVKAHFLTMRDHSQNRYSLPDLVLFYGVPIVVVAVAWRLGWKFDANVLAAFLTSFSIFAGLLVFVYQPEAAQIEPLEDSAGHMPVVRLS